MEIDESKVDEIIVEVKKVLMHLYEEYKKENPSICHSYVEEITESGPDQSVESDPMLEQFMRSRKDKDVVQIGNKVDKYLLEPAENLKNLKFNLLGWWKEHSPRFPIMSKVAKDIFVVSISSVHSESAFSARKKVVDPFRACLTPKTVEALICTNDWLRSEGFDFNKEPTEDELELYLT